MHPLNPLSTLRTLSKSALLAAMLCITACAPSDEWQGTVEEYAGGFIVRNPEKGVWADGPGARLSFELEQVFGTEREPAGAILGEPYELSIATDEDANLYVLDGQAKRLVSFGPEGNVRWRVGQAGEGPGEFDNPSQIAVSPRGVVVVMNNSRTRLDTWDSAGDYVSSVSLTDPPLSVSGSVLPFIAGFSAPDALVLFGGIRGGTGSRVAVIDLASSSIRHQFEWDQLPDVRMPVSLSSEAPVLARPGRIFVGSGAGYQFRIYSTDGSIEWHVTRAVDYPVRSGFFRDERGEGVSSFGEVLAPMPLDPHYFLVCVTWVTGVENPDEVAVARIQALRERRRPRPMEEASSFDLYDAEGRFLYSAIEEGGQWPSTGRPQFIGVDNRLYTIAEDPFPQVRRYRVLVH